LSWSAVGSWAEHLEHGPASGNSKKIELGLRMGYGPKMLRAAENLFEFIFKNLSSKMKDSNIFKLNLNGVSLEQIHINFLKTFQIWNF
jgi:hypothetical protein